MDNFHHVPVLLNETLAALQIKSQGLYLDGTLGGAGHSSQILKQLKGGVLIGVDKDADALAAATAKLKTDSFKTTEISFSQLNPTPNNVLKENAENKIVFVHSDFKDIPAMLKEKGILLDGVLLDLGVSSYQIDTPIRGFSFRHDAPLDMRMNQSQAFSAYTVVNEYDEDSLVHIFRVYGEEEFARPIARNIVKQRQIQPIETTGKLNEIIENSMPKKVVFSRGGAAKKVFQAIRIEVNGELDKLSECIADYLACLKPGGRMVVITFHSLEDRIVKTVFKEKATACICPKQFAKCVCGHKAEIKILTNHPITASEEELKQNSRCSCAKLRIAEKT